MKEDVTWPLERAGRVEPHRPNSAHSSWQSWSPQFPALCGIGEWEDAIARCQCDETPEMGVLKGKVRVELRWWWQWCDVGLVIKFPKPNPGAGVR